MTSSNMLRSRPTSSRARSSAMLCRSSSSSISPLAPGEEGCVYQAPLCQLSQVVATRRTWAFRPGLLRRYQKGAGMSQKNPRRCPMLPLVWTHRGAPEARGYHGQPTDAEGLAAMHCDEVLVHGAAQACIKGKASLMNTTRCKVDRIRHCMRE